MGFQEEAKLIDTKLAHWMDGHMSDTVSPVDHDMTIALDGPVMYMTHTGYLIRSGGRVYCYQGVLHADGSHAVDSS